MDPSRRENIIGAGLGLYFPISVARFLRHALRTNVKITVIRILAESGGLAGWPTSFQAGNELVIHGGGILLRLRQRLAIRNLKVRKARTGVWAVGLFVFTFAT